MLTDTGVKRRQWCFFGEKIDVGERLGQIIQAKSSAVDERMRGKDRAKERLSE